MMGAFNIHYLGCFIVTPFASIILPCIFIELSPLNLVFVIMDSCLGHILESTKGIEMKHGL